LSSSSRWRTTDDILSDVHKSQNALTLLSPAEKASDPITFNDIKTRLDDLETKALLQASGSDQTKAIGAKIGLLQYWSSVLGTFLDGSPAKDLANKFVL